MPYENRRSFLRRTGQTAAAATLGVTPPTASGGTPAEASDPTQRAAVAAQVRASAASVANQLPSGTVATNGDEARYPSFFATYTKGLPHSNLGEVDPHAYQLLLTALSSGKHSDFEQVPLGFTRKISNPQGAFAYNLEGADSHSYSMDPPPAFASPQAAAEMAELYWQALARDVAFADYATSPLIKRAAADLSKLNGFAGPIDSTGNVTPGNIFRGTTAADLNGPYLSQYLLKPIPNNSALLDQKYRTGMPGVDYVTQYGSWATAQSGLPPYEAEIFDSTPRYIRNGRDLAQVCHYDHPFQCYLNAALIILDQRPETILQFNVYQLNDTNPYKTSRIQAGFVTFNIANICAWLGQVTTTALKAAWYQKWCLHRRLRPDTFGGRVYNTLLGSASYPIHPQLLSSEALQSVVQVTGNALLPQAYSEGPPLHPSYPAGHAVIAGACVTVLKAMFAENALISDPVVSSSDGLTLLPAPVVSLTIGGELNKLAFNVPMGRNWGGIHYRSDAMAGILLGEAVAISFLRDQVNCVTENFAGFQFTSFAGHAVNLPAEPLQTPHRSYPR